MKSDIFLAEKFGTDNAACEQDSTTSSGKKMTVRQLLDLQEETLAKQRLGNEVVLDEDELSDEEIDRKELERFDNRNERLEIENERQRREDRKSDTFEEQLDYRWSNDEYVLLDEAVDFEAIENDSKQLFTIGNSKVGKDTIIFNLQPARFCPAFEKGLCKIVSFFDGQFKIACYAYQDERQYKTALQLRIRQMRFWDTHTAQEIYDKLEEFYILSKGSSMTYATLKAARTKKKDKPAKAATMAKTKSTKLKYIRFNQSGDLKDKEDAIKMDEIAQLAQENLGLVSYTYTARRDILKNYSFKHVHVQGSGFSAITSVNEPVHGKKGGEFVGKVFTAFPSIFNKSHKLQKRIPGKIYYEDIFEKKTPDGKINPLHDQYSLSNPSGWYACPGDCNSCVACKSDKFKHIAVKIHRSFQKINTDWHDVKRTEKGYEIKQKMDVYQRDEKGKPTTWTPEMDKEYENRATVIQKEKDFLKLPKKEQVEILTNELKRLYDLLDDDSDPERRASIKKDINKWQLKAEKRGIDWKQVRLLSALEEPSE